jgi:hypothetical protein
VRRDVYGRGVPVLQKRPSRTGGGLSLLAGALSGLLGAFLGAFFRKSIDHQITHFELWWEARRSQVGGIYGCGTCGREWQVRCGR